MPCSPKRLVNWITCCPSDADWRQLISQIHVRRRCRPARPAPTNETIAPLGAARRITAAVWRHCCCCRCCRFAADASGAFLGLPEWGRGGEGSRPVTIFPDGGHRPIAPKVVLVINQNCTKNLHNELHYYYFFLWEMVDFFLTGATVSFPQNNLYRCL